MPLKSGKENIGSNIKEEMSHGKSRAQSIAIALSVAAENHKKKKKKEKEDKAEKGIKE